MSAPSPALEARPGAARAMSPSLVVLVLSLLLGLQPVTTDLYLPALPGLTTNLGASKAQAQFTLTALLLAFGISQLVWGALSDRFGRRPVLLAGLATYTVAAAGGAFAPSMELLVAWRTLQGVAMGASVMGARAIVRDIHAGAAGAQLMAKGLSGLGVIALACAPLGGALAQWVSWRAALAAPAVFSACALAVMAWRFGETLPPALRAPLHPAALVRQWGQIVRSPVFLTWSALATATYGGLFVFLASSSFVFIEVLGLSRMQYGLAMSSMCVAYIAGTLLCRRLLRRSGMRGALRVSGFLALAAALAMAALSLSGARDPLLLLGTFWIYSLSHGINMPCSQSGAVSPFPAAAGAASALNGFIMMAAAFACGAWVGRHLDGTPFVLEAGVGAWAAVIVVVNWFLVPRFAAPRHA